VAYFGILRTGAVFTPLSPLLSPREVAYQLNDSGAETLISMDLLYPGISSAIPNTGVKRVIITSLADCFTALNAPLKPIGKTEIPDTLDMAALLRDHKPLAEDVAVDVKKDLAHLAYTGGTTGVSKGVMLTHFNVVANVIQVVHWMSGAQVEMIDGVITPVYPPGVDPKIDRLSNADEETALVVVPWFHAMGTVGYLTGQIYGGSAMVVLLRFDPREYMESIKKYKVTMLGGAPQLYIPLINLEDFDDYDLSGIKFAGSGAAPLPLAVMDKLLETFSGGVVNEGYGLTECTMCATLNPPFRETIRPGAVGIPVFDTEIKVVDPATGADLPSGSEGEICISGPQIMQGYWNRLEATAEVLKDGWLLTGDIGREDEDGFFFITDRKKDLIIYKGYNVYPRELEEIIFEHPAVQQCAVVGKPDPQGGEAPVAFIELKAGARATADEIMEHANPQIAHYKKIREVIFVDAIPVSGAGKVLKTELRKHFQNG